VRKATAGFAISLIAGIIILVNALLIFAAASIISSFGSIIPSVPGVPGVAEAAAAIVTLLGAVGLVFAIIVIVGAVLIYMPGKEVLGGILVLIFSILSIVIGGGFFIGLILGIIGGALGIAKK
jgi:hypothetical protein